MLVLFNQVIGGVDILSGGEKITVELLKRWKRLMKIVVIMPQHGLRLIKEKEGLNVDCIALPLTFLDKKNLYWKYSFFIPIIWFIHTIRSCVKLLNINIEDKKIFSSGDFFCNTIPAFLLKIKDRKMQWVASIFHIIDSPFKRKSGDSFLSNLASYGFQKFSFQLIKNKANKILVLNEDVKLQLANMGFDGKRLYSMGAGVDFSLIDSIAPNKDSYYDACFMARLSPTKGISDIPRIWKQIIQKRINSRLVIIGSGTEKEERKLHYLISKYNLDTQIDVVGLKIGADKYKLMKSSKLFIFPSYEEGFAISILEAMACKLVVVAWDLPAYKSIYEEAIVTVPKGNIAMFAKEILHLLSDDSLRNMRAEQAYIFASRYDWDLVAKNAYEKINN